MASSSFTTELPAHSDDLFHTAELIYTIHHFNLYQMMSLINNKEQSYLFMYFKLESMIDTTE